MSDETVWEIILKYRRQVLLVLAGLIFTGLGVIVYRESISASTKIEVIEGTTESQGASELVVEITGAVVNPGVYKFSKDSRIDDVIKKAGGFTNETDTAWVEKYVNRAAKLSDGQKIFIPTIGESRVDQSTSGAKTDGLVSINTASLSDLESLPGIGPVYAKNITEQRPYSNIDELTTKGVVPKNVFEKIKNKITVY